MTPPPMERLTEDEVDEGHATAFVKALVAELRERREWIVAGLSSWGQGSADPSAISARCGRLSAFDEVLKLIVKAKGKEPES